MRIRLIENGAVVATATLDSCDGARDFAALLPLDLTLEDYASTEKIADLPGRLSTKGMPDAYKPSAGDICFYAPWGNLAVFYKDGDSSEGLVRLGVLDSVPSEPWSCTPMHVRLEMIRSPTVRDARSR